MKKLCSLAISIILIFTPIQNVNAHARLVSSNPTKNQIVKVLPPMVWIEFDGDLLILEGKDVNRITVTSSEKKRVNFGGSIVGGARISTRLRSGLSPGKYLITYRIVSEDGHPIEGSFAFKYKPK